MLIEMEQGRTFLTSNGEHSMDVSGKRIVAPYLTAFKARTESEGDAYVVVRSETGFLSKI